MSGVTGIVFNIQRFSIHDGPGIRTTVFLKGCPLRCPWCSNPESQLGVPELMFSPLKCIRCGHCIAVCPASANVRVDNNLIVNRKICQGCGKCVDECPGSAREIVGSYVNVDDVLREVERDILFYKNSNGGVTVSGGEPATQSDFVAALLQGCVEKKLHTAVETCGYADSKDFVKIIAHTKLVLFDIKNVDSKVNERLTGYPRCEIVLDNLRMAGEKGIPIIGRLTVIPGITDSVLAVRRAAKLFAEIKNVVRLELLPYHRLGESKYEGLGRKYMLDCFPPSETKMEMLKKSAEEYGGLEVSVL